MAGVNAFAVPPPLVAARKKRRTEGAVAAEAKDVDGYHAFFTTREYAQFSQFGGEPETQRYQQEQRLRRTLLSSGAEEAAHDSRQKTKADPMSKLKSVHIMVLLEDLMTKRFPDANDQVALAANGRRRLSALSIEQHEAYLALVRKRTEAHSRGLPEILALSTDEAAQLRSLEEQVRDEQTDFFRLFKQATATVQAQNQSCVPPFASRWFDEIKLHDSNEARRLYTQFFETALSIPVDPSKQTESTQAGGSDPIVKHVKEVFRIGTAAMIDAGQLAPGMQIAAMGDEAASANGRSSWVQREAISADPNAEGLMLKYDCDVAISSSTLLELFDLATTSVVAETVHRWVIPVKSRVVVSSDGKPKKLVCLDRALRGPNVCTRDKIALAGRFLALDQLKSRSGAPAHQASGQTVYHVWRIGDKRALVRTTIHGYLVENENPDAAFGRKGVGDSSADPSSTTKRSVALSVFVKPDYRDVGLREQLTVSERCKFWLHSWLRGSSRVVVARLDPKTSVIDEWETHSLKTLVYGRSGEGEAQHADYFDPMTKFDALAHLVTCLCDLSSGNYLVQPSLHDKRDRRVDILSSTSSQTGTTASCTGDSNKWVDLYQYLEVGRADGSEMAPEVVTVLPEWYRYDRIPYTFRSGTYCQEFFQDGACSLLGSGQYCEGRHIRLAPSKSAASQWRFEDITTVLRRGKHAEHRKRPTGRPVLLRPSFPFCVGEKIVPTVTVANPNAPAKCRKDECQLRHFTAHEIAERVADAAERAERGKRRDWRKKFKPRQESDWSGGGARDN